MDSDSDTNSPARVGPAYSDRADSDTRGCARRLLGPDSGEPERPQARAQSVTVADSDQVWHCAVARPGRVPGPASADSASHGALRLTELAGSLPGWGPGSSTMVASIFTGVPYCQWAA
jgi:hypothetical protein